jgi:hypothetical protein
MGGILRCRVPKIEPHLKSIFDDKKEQMAIDNDEIYQIIVTKIFQKNKYILLFPSIMENGNRSFD